MEVVNSERGEIKVRCPYNSLKSIHRLVGHPRNTNIHPEKQIKLLAENIHFQGWRYPIIVSNLSGFLVSGHGRLEAAKLLGCSVVPIVNQDFDNEAQEYAFLESDNHIKELSEFDQEKFKLNMKDFEDLDLTFTGLPEFELDVDIEVLEPQCDEDDVPEVKAEPLTKRGDVWLLGEHRVMCGDSTMIDDVEKLMNGQKADMVFTDPPYGMDYQLNTTKVKLDKIKNDSSDFNINNLWATIYSIPVKYICTRYDKYVDWQNQIEEKVKNVIVWAKSNMGAGDLKNYGFQHEFIMYWGNKIDGKRDTNLWNEGNTPKSEYVSHPTQKPISLVERAIGNHDLKKVYDSFLGSGSTLIACEKTNRKCFGMELDEHYCDVIIERWQKYTGKEAKLESTGQTYNSLRQ